MYFVEDERFARALQNKLDSSQVSLNKERKQKEKNLNPTDANLELADPTPSIHDLFVTFDKKFFWGALGMVEVKWSNRMTSCAGVCSFQGPRGLCKISLSAPLLSLRPRKDLVETLLHEMIHAYLFVTNNYKDRECHGPEFRKHMHRINNACGTSITVYHTFHDEVDHYKVHIWRCDGPCKFKKPYFGLVQRAMNRAPGPNDYWWARHKLECNGNFIKISQPEKKSKKKPTKRPAKIHNKGLDIRNFFSNETKFVKSPDHVSVSNCITSSNGSSSDDLKFNKKTSDDLSVLAFTKTHNKSEGTKQSGIKHPVNKTDTELSKSTKLNESIQNNKTSSFNENGVASARDQVRKVWCNKFLTETKPEEKVNEKKIKIQCPVCDKGFSEADIQVHVNECLQENNQIDKIEIEYQQCLICSKQIKKSYISEHLENCLNCSLDNSEDIEDEVMCDSVPCPCCYLWFKEIEMNRHLDECLTMITLKQELSAS